jgi:AcrR family transcriptional regulator
METEAVNGPNMEEKILAAAERFFLEKGFGLTSTTEIAKEAGCNQALVHYYFRTKLHLFERIFEGKVKLFIMSFFEISSEDIPFTEKLRRKISSHYDILLENPYLPYLVINELLTNDERIKSVKEKLAPYIGSVLAQFERELSEEIRKGTIRQMSAFDLILSIVSLDVFPFISAPIMKNVLGLDDAALHGILVKRKDENIEIVLRSLRP